MIPTFAFDRFLTALFGWAAESSGLQVLDKPMWIFPGQTFRIALQQPAGAGDLQLEVPETLELFDHWPKDAIQRFYFRALEPGDATLRFEGHGGSCAIPLEVLPWSAVFQPRQWKAISLPRIWPLEVPALRELKMSRTLHTPEEIESLKDREPGSIAQRWHDLTDEQVFQIIPGPCVPRTCLMVLGGYEDARGKGCPVCGTRIYEGRSGFYPWLFDPENHPWKVGCPSCGTWFPSNDFQNGDRHSGDFPDDGFGCEPVSPILAPNGEPWRWPFIAYYHEWPAYMNEFMVGIPQCAEAFVSTGDPVYAHKAAVALFRLAESLLDLAVNLNHRKLAVRNGVYQPPVGAPDPRAMERLQQSFLYIQPNWDTPRLERCARAWDLIFDQLEDDPALVAFCQAHYHPEIQSIEDFRWFVESGLIRVTLQACLDDAVSRNYPMQEVTVATMALSLAIPRCEQVVDQLLNGPRGVRFGLTNEFFKDGSGHESESYNGIQIRDMTRLFLTLERLMQRDPDRYRPPRFVSPLKDPKFRRLYDFPLEDSLIGRTYPSTGDCGSPRTDPWPLQEGFPLARGEFAEVYRRTRDPRFAQVLYGPEGRVPSDLHEPELRAEVERIGRERGWRVATRSGFCDGYGHAILRSGEGDQERALWLRYGRVIQHAHADMLTFGLEALQRKMLPELGYPQGWTYASAWEVNWGTHYGTHIVDIPTGRFGRGRLTLFAETPPAQIAVAESAAGHEGWRQRTIVLVDRPDGGCYAVSLERVRGGTRHLHSFHGPDGEATLRGIDLQPQEGGTALGPDVAYGDDSAVAGGDRELAFLAFLYDVARGHPRGPWSMDYALRNQEEVYLRKTMLFPTDAILTVAKGKPPGGGRYPYEMTWDLLERTGESPLTSQFLMVLEPYRGTSGIESVELLPLRNAELPDHQFPPLALRVTLTDWVDVLVFQPDPGMVCETEEGLLCAGEFGFWRTRRDDARTLVAAVLAHGTLLRWGNRAIRLPQAAITGQVVRCDWTRHSLVFLPVPDGWESLQGRPIQIANDAGSHTVYRIEDVRLVSDGCEVILDLDPRIGEGFVRECQDDAVVSHMPLRLASLAYYAGKTLANEDGSAVYRLKDVEGQVRCVVDTARHGRIPAAQLADAFRDRDGDGLSRYIIYDYGPGDRVRVALWTSIG